MDKIRFEIRDENKALTKDYPNDKIEAELTKLFKSVNCRKYKDEIIMIGNYQYKLEESKSDEIGPRVWSNETTKKGGLAVARSHRSLIVVFYENVADNEDKADKVIWHLKKRTDLYMKFETKIT